MVITDRTVYLFNCFTDARTLGVYRDTIRAKTPLPVFNNNNNNNDGCVGFNTRKSLNFIAILAGRIIT